jgi:hypothetical protein
MRTSVRTPTVCSLFVHQSSHVCHCLADADLSSSHSVCPRPCPSPELQVCKYLRWFARPSLVAPRVSVVRLWVGVWRSCVLLRFSMGCRGLVCMSVNAQGYLVAQRICPWCPLLEVGDECHPVVTCPVLERNWCKYTRLHTSWTDTVVHFLWLDDLVSVAPLVFA